MLKFPETPKSHCEGFKLVIIKAVKINKKGLVVWKCRCCGVLICKQVRSN